MKHSKQWTDGNHSVGSFRMLGAMNAYKGTDTIALAAQERRCKASNLTLGGKVLLKS
jgi:hypothetical protein